MSLVVVPLSSCCITGLTVVLRLDSHTLPPCSKRPPLQDSMCMTAFVAQATYLQRLCHMRACLAGVRRCSQCSRLNRIACRPDGHIDTHTWSLCVGIPVFVNTCFVPSDMRLTSSLQRHRQAGRPWWTLASNVSCSLLLFEPAPIN